MLKSTVFVLLLAAITLGLPVIANAQAIPDLPGSITLGSQIDDIIKAQKDRDRANALGEDETIDGEAGIYVLRRNEIFFVGGGVSTGYSNNPLRTADDVGGSYSANFAFSTGIQTKVAEKFDVGLSLNISGVEYDEEFVPSSRTLNGSLSIGTPIGETPLYVNVTGFGGWSFNSDFEPAFRLDRRPFCARALGSRGNGVKDLKTIAQVLQRHLTSFMPFHHGCRSRQWEVFHMYGSTISSRM
jgi:hypothetical protein